VRILRSIQLDRIQDPVRSKFAMVAPVVEATLLSLNRARIERLGGIDQVTLQDLAREVREGSGDAGICFEYAVHEAIATRNPLIRDLASEVLETFCGIPGGADSILFGPEKEGTIPILESVQDALTDDSRVYVGNRGHPAKLRRYIPQIINAFHRAEARNRLPRSISGLWKADLFIGSPTSEKWVGTTVKVQPAALQGAQGLRIGIYPRQNVTDTPRKDDALNLIRLPLPYDDAFMELFYKSFYLVRAFLRADARVPPEVDLPDAEDRFVTNELQQRAMFATVDVVRVIREMSQDGLLENQPVVSSQPTQQLSRDEGLAPAASVVHDEEADSLVSLTPEPLG
jgi:hypothetical protein